MPNRSRYKHRTHAELVDLECRVLEIVLRHGNEGLNKTQVWGFLSNRSSINPRFVEDALRELAQAGRIDRQRLHGCKGITYTPPGIVIEAARMVRSDSLVVVETPAMAKALENLFSICPHRYSDGEIIVLERGRVGMRPGQQIPTRVAGAW